MKKEKNQTLIIEELVIIFIKFLITVDIQIN